MPTHDSQLEHDASASPANCSQCARLLAAFHEAGEGTWVPTPELAKAMSDCNDGTSLYPGRRVFDLKRKIAADGLIIESKTITKDGQRHGFYRLIRIDPAAPSTLSSNPSQP